MAQFRHGRTEDEAQAAVRRPLFPYLQPTEDEAHTHPYALCLVDQENGGGVELTAFEAPCPNGDAANHVRILVATLRELADEVTAAHADILDPDPAPTHQCEVVNPDNEVLCQMSAGHEGAHHDGTSAFELGEG